MKHKIIRNRIVALLMVLTTLLLSVFPTSKYTYASEENSTDLWEEARLSAESEAKKTREAQEDAQYPNKNSYWDWKIATEEDNLPWNRFHNAVQEDIVEKYCDENVIKEQTIELKKKNKNGNLVLTGEKGRVDIYRKTSEKTYIWEVKPSSYQNSEKRKKALDQLDGYVISKEGAVRGSNDLIKDGECYVTFKKQINGESYEVTYTIPYSVGEDGIIIYYFIRSVKKIDKKTESEAAEGAKPNTIDLPSKHEGGGHVMNPISTVIPEPPAVSDWIITLLLASAMQQFNHQFNKNPDTSTSVTVFEEEESIEYMMKVGEKGIKLMRKTEAMQAAANGMEVIDLSTGQVLSDSVIANEAAFMEINSLPLASGMGDSSYLCLESSLTTEEISLINEATADYRDMLEIVHGKDIIEDIYLAFAAGDEEKINMLIACIQGGYKGFERASKAQPPRDPLVIDLGTAGIELHSIDNGVNFDLDNNGFAEKTAWIGVEDGFLALDRNGNGKIDNGGELFGDQVILINGEKSTSGFEALAELNDHEDSVIDDQDSMFDKLLVWVDSNHNGKSEANELMSLESLKIKAIGLEHSENSFVDEETGTRIAETAKVTIKSGIGTETVDISEFWFPINTSDTTHGNTVTAGNVPSLEQALQDDETGELFSLVYQFSESNNIAMKRYYLKEILYYLTDASDIPANSRGGNIDARDLKVIESFMGREFEGVGGADPNVNAANILKGIYSDIENKYYSILNIYSSLGGYLYGVYEYKDSDGNKKLNLAYLFYVIDTQIACGENVDSLIYDLCIYMQSYDEINGTNYFQEVEDYCKGFSGNYSEIVELSKAGNIYIGTENNDSYIGTNLNDFIFGEGGNDTLGGGAGIDLIYGGAGNDTLYGNDGNDHLYGNDGDDLFDGGAGNDILEDDGGNDTYVFTRGYGTDTIMDNGGTNTLRFANLTEKDILVNGIDEYDVAIKIKGTNDTLIIWNFRENDDLADYMLEFKDQTMHCTDENSPFRHIYGSDSDDVLKAVVDGSIMHAFSGNDTVIGSDGKDVIYGNNGNDTIYAGEENDTIYGGNDDDVIYGEAGDDVIFGEDGQDTIDGGAGNDYIYSGNGDDILLFGRDYERDIIEDSDGITTIQLADPLTASEITIYRIGNDAAIHINDTEDICIISGYGTSPDNYRIAFGDEIMDVKDVITEYDGSGSTDYTYIIGTADSDAIFAEQGSNLIASDGQYDYIVGGEDMDIIFGDDDTDRILAGAGNDILYGGIGGDQLYGEDGDDFLSGGAGNDYINGGTGDDSIVAGAGDDFIDGGAGDDIYFFNAGDGNDSILDSEGSNVVLFGDGITTSGLKAYRSNWNDLLITFEGLDDTLIIKNYCINDEARSFRLIFADGIVGAAADPDSVLRNINDTSGTEYMPTIYHDGITLTSSDGDDQLIGSEAADTLIGGNGNNRIIGNGGDDSLDGGAGKDYLNGGAGNDAYIYKKGYGTDTISDSEGVNTIEISGYAASEVRAYRTNWNDITLILDGSGESGLSDDSADKIVIEGFYTSDTNRNFYLSFNGSVIHATAGTSPLRTVYGTTGNDYMQGFDNQGISLHGGDGGDTLNGTDSKDYLYGGRGDDRMLASGGDDILNGESGNDYLEGGAGNDMYIIELGTGSDSINDNQGMNTISFGEGFNKDTLKAYRTNWNDLTITFEGVEDTVIIQEYFTSGDNRNFSVIFADGSRYEYNSLDNPIHQVYLTEGDDWTSAWSDDGVFMNSMSGNDTLTGGLGNDTFIGGTGNDTLTGGAGDDTYCFASGDGMDTIEDTEGVNRIILQDLLAEHVEYSYENVDGNIKFMITILETGEVITINNYDPEHFYIEYADGMVGNAVITEDGVVFVIPEEVEE